MRPIRTALALTFSMVLGLLWVSGPPAGAVQWSYPPPPGSTTPSPSPVAYYITDVENRTVLVNGQPAVQGVDYSPDSFFEVRADSGAAGSFTLVQSDGYSTRAFATAATSGGVTTLGDTWDDFTAIWIDEYQGAPIPTYPILPGGPIGFTAIWIDE